MRSPITIVEVAARDGLQNEKRLLATADKLALIDRLIEVGARRIEVASFVNPRRVPQMADGEAVIAGLRKSPQVSFIALCLNERGVERALGANATSSCGVDEIGCVMVASDSFGIANQGQTISQGITINKAMIALAKSGGLSAQVTISGSFGCPFEGKVPEARVLDIATTLAKAGAREIAFADTIGVAVPSQITSMIRAARRALGDDYPIRVHLHDTRGLAPANAWAAYEAGCRTFDSALGGLGGCPFAPNSTGNLATEELIYLFERSDVATGLDLKAARAANQWLAKKLGKALPSRVARAGDFISSPRQQECA